MSGITSVRLRNFRRYEDTTVTLLPGITFLEGENNAGKTTVFYAIEYALFGRVGTVLGPSDLMRPKASGVGVELCFTGRDGRHYRLQRVHQRPPRSRTRVVGHFTLWVRDPGEDTAERYLLSTDFDDLETDLAVVVQRALGTSRRGWDLAMHLRQGHIADILDGSRELDIVLGVTSAVFVEEELRAMALEREKAAGELPALDATLERLVAERGVATERQTALQTEQSERAAMVAQARSRSEALQGELDALAPLQQAARVLGDAEAALADAVSEHQRATARRDDLGDAAELERSRTQADDAVGAAEAAREQQRAALAGHREGARGLDARRGDLAGRLERRRGLTGGGVCDTCGQAVDAAHLQAELPELQRALAELDGEVAAATAAITEAEAELDGVDERLSAARVAASEAASRVERHGEATAEVESAARVVAQAKDTVQTARAAARVHVEADDAGLREALDERVDAERERLRTAQVRLQADLEHAEELAERVRSELEELGQRLAGLERERAEVETRADGLRADAALAEKLRVLGKAFKQVQQDLREQATATLAERTHAIHTHLSGDDSELKDVVVDPKRYVVHVTPRDIGKRVPAGQAQGGGHRLLLGLAARLALAEQLGPVPFILLDEPTYGLDARRRASLLGRVSSLNVSDQLLLITHHDVGDAGGQVVRVVRDGKDSQVQQEAP